MSVFRGIPIAALVVLSVGLATAAHAGSLLVANKSDDTVNLVDLKTGETVTTLDTGEGPHEAVSSPDGKTWVVSNYGKQGAPGSSLAIYTRKGKAWTIDTMDLGEHTRPHGLAWLPQGHVAVTTEGSKHLLVVDPAARTVVREIVTGQEISHMVVVTKDGGRAFVANIGSGSVTVLDLNEGTKIKDVVTGAGAEGIAITPDGKEVWVSNRAADTVTVIDSKTLDVLAEIPCKGFPIRVAVTPDGKRVLVSCARSGEVAVLDRAERKELLRRKLDLSPVEGFEGRLFGDRFGESPVPVGLVIEPGGKRAFVAATQADVVVVVDPETLDVIDVIEAGREPDGMAYVPGG